MVAILTGDIVDSRAYSSADVWLKPLKGFLKTHAGATPQNWEILRGDSFQLRTHPSEALSMAVRIKALIRGLGKSDVRISIGLGAESSRGASISESYGDAYTYSGEGFEKLKSRKRMLLIQSPSLAFNLEFDLLLRFLEVVANEWSAISAQTAFHFLERPSAQQKELAEALGISQPSVSARYHRAHLDEISALLAYFTSRTEQLIAAE